jgi:hypothetical protein
MSAAAATGAGAGRVIETQIPARLDRLPWARFHWLVVLGLGIVWILDGLEVTIVGAIAGQLTESGSGLAISESQVGLAAAIDELIPARLRGTVGLAINGSFWLGTAAGAPRRWSCWIRRSFAEEVGGRLAFGLGAILGVGILLVRRHVPESPRWMIIHCREREADELVSATKQSVADGTGRELAEPRKTIKVRQHRTLGFWKIAKTRSR